MIPIRNVYYMLSYAFRILKEEGYRKLATEEFRNAADLCSAILIRGIETQLKRGLGRAYVVQTDRLSVPRGKIEFSETVRSLSVMSRKLDCSFDEFSVDSDMNRIVKSTMLLLLRSNAAAERKRALRKLLVYFSEVGTADLYTVNWNIRYDRCNETYRMLIAVCELVCKGLIQRSEAGKLRMTDYLDDQRMCRLYERFILEYYRQEHPELTAAASRIKWQLDDDADALLPVMQTDITLSDPDGMRVLIIDAKYYGHMLQTQYDVQTVHSGNLYQIFTYVKNKDTEMTGRPHEVSGMLLYARTDETFLPDVCYRMSGNRIAVRTLDLNCDFPEIRRQLDGICKQYVGQIDRSSERQRAVPISEQRSS